MQRKLLLMVIAVVVAAGCARPSTPPPGPEVYLPPAEAQPGTQPAAGHAEPQKEAPPSLVLAASGEVERFTLAPGEPVPSIGMYFLEVATGKVEGWRLPDSSDRSPYLISYRVSDDGRWVTAAGREDTYLIDRRQGRVWAAEGDLETASARLLVLHEGRGRYRVYETTNLREISRFELQTKAYSVEVFIAPDEERLFIIPTRGAESARLYRVDLPSGRVEEAGDLPAIIAAKAIWGAWLRPSRQGENLWLQVWGSPDATLRSRSYLVRLDWEGKRIDHLAVEGGPIDLNPAGDAFTFTQDIGEASGAVVAADRAGRPFFRVKGLGGHQWMPDGSGLLVPLEGTCQKLTLRGAFEPLPACGELPPETYPIPAPDDPNLIALFPLGVISLDGQVRHTVTLAEPERWEVVPLDPWGDQSREYRFWVRQTPPRDGGYLYAWDLPLRVEFPPFDNRLVVKGTGDCLNLREWPVSESKILTCLPDGSILEPLITDGPPGDQWGRVRTEQGLEGWVCVSCGYLDWVK